MSEFCQLPPQNLPFNKKTKEWRKKHLDFADSKTFFNYSLDIAIPDKRIVIEYDGSYWHQDKDYDNKRKKYLENQ